MEANIPKIQIDAIENNGEKANPSETPKQGDLTPEEENYLKKELLSRAIHREVLFLKEETSLARLDRTTILKFFFANYLAEFPLLRKTKKKFWDKMQTLSANMEQLKLSNAIERGEETSGDKIFRRVERKIVLVMNSAIKITSSDWLQQAQASRQAATEGLFSSVQIKEDFEAKIYATRKVSEKRMTGTVTKMNYIIISKFGDKQGIVARSMSEIEELHGKLKKEFKEIKLPSMPKKIKVRNPSAEIIEKRRKDLNYYIRNILIHEEIRKCDLVRNFLFEDMTNLSDAEQQNVDKTREQEVQDQLKEAALQKDIEDRTNQMFKVTSEFFEYLAANGGFPTFIKTLKDNPDMTGLPENYQRLFELVRLKISFLVYNTLHRDDGHQEAFEKFKSLYNIIPFTALVVILKISNPFLLLRGLFELFLARPFGAKSLMQRMLSLSMNDDMKEAKSEKVKMLEELGNNQDLAKKVENFVNNEEARSSISVTEIEEMSEEQYVRLVLTCDKIEPPISSQFINNLTEEQFEKIYQLIGMEFAARDAKLLISFMGNSEITDVIKEMFTMFYLPLVELYKKVDLGQLIKTVASYMKAVIAVAEANKREIDGRKIFQQYLQIFKDHEQGIYKFVNELLTQEAGILRELITWGYDFFEFMRLGNSEKPIDVNRFVTTVVGEDKEKLGLLKKEVQAVKEFHIARHRRRAERLKYILTTLDKNQVGDASGTSNWEFLDDEDEDEEDDVEHADENGNNTNSDVTPRRQAKNGNKSPKQELPDHLKKIPAPKLTLVPTLVEAFVPLVADGLSGYKPKIVSVQTPWERIDGADKDPYLDLLQESSGEDGKESKSKTKSRSKSISKGKTPREVSSEATTPKEDKKDRLSPQDLKESKSVPNSPRESQGDGGACNQQ